MEDKYRTERVSVYSTLVWHLELIFLTEELNHTRSVTF